MTNTAARIHAPEQETKMQVKRYMVFHIGCLECGATSDIVGFYNEKEEAEAVASGLYESMQWLDDGHGAYEVFDLHADQAPEYADAIAALRQSPSAGKPR